MSPKTNWFFYVLQTISCQSEGRGFLDNDIFRTLRRILGIDRSRPNYYSERRQYPYRPFFSPFRRSDLLKKDNSLFIKKNQSPNIIQSQGNHIEIKKQPQKYKKPTNLDKHKDIYSEIAYKKYMSKNKKRKWSQPTKNIERLTSHPYPFVDPKRPDTNSYPYEQAAPYKRKNIFSTVSNMASSFFNRFLPRPSKYSSPNLLLKTVPHELLMSGSVGTSTRNRKDAMTPSPQQGLIKEDAFQPIFRPSQTIDVHATAKPRSKKRLRRKDSIKSLTQPQMIDFFQWTDSFPIVDQLGYINNKTARGCAAGRASWVRNVQTWM